MHAKQAYMNTNTDLNTNTNTKYCGEDFVGVTACKARERLQLNPQLFSRDLLDFKIKMMIMFMMMMMIMIMIMMMIIIITLK